MTLTTPLTPRYPAQSSKAFAKRSPRHRATPPYRKSARTSLWGIAFCGLVLMVGGSNRVLRQTGTAMAFMAGGAIAATVVQQDERLIEIRRLQAGHKKREATLNTALEVALAESEAIATQLTQMNAGLGNWQTDKVLVAGQLEVLANKQRQLLCELYQTAVMETTLQKEVTEAQAHITELEAALTAKTNLATEMLTELEAEATSTFDHFNAKINTQSKLINDLQRQMEALRRENTALTDQTLIDKSFETTSSDSLIGNRLFDYLTQS